MKCIVDMDALMDMDEPIENLKNATAALVMAHSDLDQDTFAGKAIAFLCNAMTRDAYDLAEAWGASAEKNRPLRLRRTRTDPIGAAGNGCSVRLLSGSPRIVAGPTNRPLSPAAPSAGLFL